MHSNAMKMRILLRKTKTDSLGTIKVFIEVSMMNVPITITYEQVITVFRQKANDKFPSQLVEGRTTSLINQGIGRGQGRGRERHDRRGGGRGGGRERDNKRKWNDHFVPQMYKVRLKNERIIDCHPSFRFEYKTWKQLSDNKN